MRSGYASDTILERRVTDLERKQRASSAGGIASVGTFSLGTGVSTSTVIADATVTTASVIFYTPNNANAWSVDGTLNSITPGAGQFTIGHQASSSARTYNYIVINPI